MPAKSSAGLAAGLIAEAAVIGLVVTLLPKVNLGPAPGGEMALDFADERPSLAPERLPSVAADSSVAADWRTSVSRPETPIQLPPADPQYVEQRLDSASQQLLNGVSKYLSQHAQELLQPPRETSDMPPTSLPPAYTSPSFPAPSGYRY